MAETRKVLGQAALSSALLTDIYIVPSSTQTVVSTIVVTNRSGAARTFRLSIAVGGGADLPEQYISYNVALPKDTFYTLTLGITLGSGDVVRAFASGTNCSVNIFGVEIT